MNSVFRFVTVVLIFAFVIVVTQITTRYIASLQKTQMKDGRIKLLDAARLNGNTYIQIVRISGKVMALAVSKDNVTVLCELESEDFDDNDQVDDEKRLPDFKEIFDRAKDKFTRKES